MLRRCLPRSGPTVPTIAARRSDRRGAARERRVRDGSGAGGTRRRPADGAGASGATGVRPARPRSGSRSRSGCGCSASPARPARASGAACARRRRPSGRRGPSRSPRRAGRSPRAGAPGPRPSASSWISSNSRRVRSTRRAADEGLELVGADLDLADRRPGRASTRASARLRRRTTASTRAISSSGWHGLVTQSSAPSRSPRTRWATDDWPVQTTTPSAGQPRAELLEVGPAPAGRAPRGRSTTRVEPHRDHRVERDRAGEHAVLPARAVQPLA